MVGEFILDTTDEHYNRALKYTLYEYELFLLETEGKDIKPKLRRAYGQTSRNPSNRIHKLPCGEDCLTAETVARLFFIPK
jgi:hypothetical protein